MKTKTTHYEAQYTGPLGLFKPHVFRNKKEMRDYFKQNVEPHRRQRHIRQYTIYKITTEVVKL
jgi:hypothetical protein